MVLLLEGRTALRVSVVLGKGNELEPPGTLAGIGKKGKEVPAPKKPGHRVVGDVLSNKTTGRRRRIKPKREGG